MIFSKVTLDRVNRAEKTLDGAAGKSVNVAKVLRELGQEPVAVGFGGGPWGDSILNDLQSRGIKTDFVQVSAPTRQCITVIDESTGAVTELVEESQAVAEADYERLMQIVQRRLAGCKAAIMSGTITPEGPNSFYARCVKAASSVGVLSIVDASGPPLVEAIRACPGLVKPNRDELAATVGRPLENDTAVAEAMRQLCEWGAERVVVTAGKQPTLALDGETLWRVEAPVIQAVNPIGSGDALTAALAWRLLAGDNLGEACHWAVAAGAANALSPMPGNLLRSDLERLVAEVKTDPVRLC